MRTARVSPAYDRLIRAISCGWDYCVSPLKPPGNCEVMQKIPEGSDANLVKSRHPRDSSRNKKRQDGALDVAFCFSACLCCFDRLGRCVDE